MPDLLIHADTERSATLRDEVPLAVGDPFTWMEADGRVVVLTNVLVGDDFGLYQLLDDRRRWPLRHLTPCAPARAGEHRP